MKVSLTTFSINCHFAECCDLFIVMLSVIMLNVFTLSVILLNVVTLSVILLNVVMLSVVLRAFRANMMSPMGKLVALARHLTKKNAKLSNLTTSL
jgi:hypothetical protein